MTDAPRRETLVVLAPVYLSVFLFMAGTGALQVLVPVYLAREAGVGPTAIGLVVGVFGVASLAARLPVGMTYSVRRSSAFMLAGGALSAASFALMPLVTRPALFGVLMAVNGLGWSIATTAQLALLVARPPGGASTAVAMGWFSGAAALGNVAAGVLGGGTADTIGLRPTFLVFAATPLIGAILMVRGIAAADGLTDDASPTGLKAPQARPLWGALVRMPLAVWVGVLVMFFINAMNAITNTFHPLLALAAGLSLTQIGLLSSIRSWASSWSRLGSGLLFSRVNPAALTLPLVVAGSVATAFIPSVVGSFLLQIPLFAAAGLSRGLLRVTGSADAFDSVPADERQHGLTAALLYGGLDVGKIAAPIIGGVVAGAFGIATMFRVVPLGFLALYLVLAFAARRAMRESVTPPARP